MILTTQPIKIIVANGKDKVQGNQETDTAQNKIQILQFMPILQTKGSEEYKSDERSPPVNRDILTFDHIVQRSDKTPCTKHDEEKK
ncbi:MAG: hypothetical protein K0R82_1037 [Flavipsychrobacter sp.]|nr:hypothetical protein [Flavipsychrobacter sp.]